MNNLLENIKILISLIKQIYDELLVKAAKDNSLKEVLKKVSKLKGVTTSILENLQTLQETNPNIFVCYENDIYLYVENKKYIIAYSKNEETAILATERKLKKALEQFYKYAYQGKIK